MTGQKTNRTAIISGIRPRHDMNLPSGYNRQALHDAMKGHVVGKGELIGMYQRKPDVRDDK